ncbi:DUF4440 domain-containing protein [Oceanicola sp. D3]|uniref:DUF4440 domain-containing protein n=1 Tax=Oceanicola sp. D3 TaxID=2587163 RepID=UPI00111EA84D|nr:DUF4440 domain-containing protein [Oceanicola sp. D3]QDC11409.1 DUF4440 domain-containing protein [Oceanicola sp. D3]
MQESFDTFLTRRRDAAMAYAHGDDAPMRTITALSGMATAFTRDGGFARGARSVNEANARQAEDFVEGQTRLEIEDSGTEGDVGYWTGFQISEVMVEGADVPRRERLRVTEIYRRIGETWQRVHRHASPVGD